VRVCDAAVEVLRETNNPAVMWGDVWLLHAIADRAGLAESRYPSHRERRVLAALTKQPGILIPRLTRIGSGRSVRIFRLPT
jgi:hypothetical protein